MIYDIIVVGAGASGLISAIVSAKSGQKTLLIEQLDKIGTKLLATGGSRCNLSNTLDIESFIKSFGKNGRFLQDAIKEFNYKDLIKFLNSLGVDTHIPDGFRIFPTTHKSHTVVDALLRELKRLNVNILYNHKFEDLIIENNIIKGIKASNKTFLSSKVIVATGGLGYKNLGATGESFDILKKHNHTITSLYPAMMPLITEQIWVKNCTANTIAKVTIKVDLPKIKKLNKIKATGDLIFTKDGIRGPVVLDFAREITPYLDKYEKVPIKLHLTNLKNEDNLIVFIKKTIMDNPKLSIGEILEKLLPISVIRELCNLVEIDSTLKYKEIEGYKKDKLHKIIISTPLDIIGHKGFKNAMITRGGISTKEIDPKTMQSKIIKNLYFCGEIIDIDGPCGGYNLQWAFSSGYLSGKL